MAEYQHQAKFKAVLDERQLEPHPSMDELLSWCYEFQRVGLVPNPASGKKGGNLSFRTDDGFITTPSGKPLDQLKREDLVKVTELDEKLFTVHATGLIYPTSEAFLHGYLYLERKESNAIFHGECELITKNASSLGIPETENWREYGTPPLAYEVLNVLRTHPNCDVLVMKDHGEIYLGRTMREAGNLARETLSKAKRLI